MSASPTDAAPRPWTIARIAYGALWFVAAVPDDDPARATWTIHERDALRFDGLRALELHPLIAAALDTCCYMAREGYGAVCTHHAEGRA